MNELEVPAEWIDLVSVVEAVTDADEERFLTADERARASGFKSARRRHEWAAARIAARLLAMRRGIIEAPADLTIAVRDSCPYAAAGSGEWSLSLSHSGTVGAAAIGVGRVGVDLERPRYVDPASVRFFLSDDEIEVFRKLGHLDDAVVHFWSAKEAAFKAAPHARLLRQVRFTAIEAGTGRMMAAWSDGETDGQVETRVLPQGFVLALARA